MPSPLSRQGRWSLFAHPSPSSAAFPVKQSGRLLQLLFRDLLSVHSRYGLHARRVAMRPSTPKAPTGLLPPPPLRLLPGGANQFPGGSCTGWSPAPFTAHCFANNPRRRPLDTLVTQRVVYCESDCWSWTIVISSEGTFEYVAVVPEQPGTAFS